MKKKINFEELKNLFYYILAGSIILALAFVGSLEKNSSNNNFSLSAFAADDFTTISSNQISEYYVVADLSNALSLASAEDAALNYVTLNSLYKVGQISSDKLEKNPVLDTTNLSRGLITYTVSDGENMESIASKFNLSTDQIRWSNGLKTTSISTGDVLYLTKNVSGIVYTVKADDTLESISEKYGSNVASIIALNGLQVSGIKEGMKIAIEGGTLPEKERPEYVPPVTRPPIYIYTYLGSTNTREDIVIIHPSYEYFGYGNDNGYAYGNCTWWAKYMRPDLPSNLGNANMWAYNARNRGYAVDNTPSAGAVFQTSAGWAGHVGYVESVNGDGSITVTEMNYNYLYNTIRAKIPASQVGNYYYIH